MPDRDRFFKEMSGRINAITLKPRRAWFDVKAADISSVADYLFNEMGCRLSTATAQEVYRGIEVIYHFSHDASGQYFCPRILMTDKSDPRMPSITPIVTGAEWIEREMAEYWGIIFEGHPRPEPLLTKDHPHGEGLGQPFRIVRKKATQSENGRPKAGEEK